MRRITFVLIGFLALAAVVGYAATGGLSTNGGDEATGGTVRGVATGSTGAAPAEGFATAPGEQVAEDGGGGSAAGLAVLPQVGPSVIRTGRVVIEIGEGGFGEAFDAASMIAGRYGGFVQSSSMAGTEVRSGDLVLRVPADRFDDAVSDLRDLGTVERQAVSGQDVTAQFVDLEARLLTWQAQEAVLLDLMGRATSIEATIRVQSELQDVRYRIEQITGQLRVLDDQTDYATIQVSLHEPGTPAVAPPGDDRPSLGEAWERAIDGFVGVFYVMVVGLGYLVPLTAIAAIGWFVYRRASAPRATPSAS
ncbi:MAG: DUF4349 domain-containing protein [Actinomycetota bacterium]